MAEGTSQLHTCYVFINQIQLLPIPSESRLEEEHGAGLFQLSKRAKCPHRRRMLAMLAHYIDFSTLNRNCYLNSFLPLLPLLLLRLSLVAEVSGPHCSGTTAMRELAMLNVPETRSSRELADLNVPETRPLRVSFFGNVFRNTKWPLRHIAEVPPES